MAQLSEELDIYNPKHLILDKALVFSRRSRIKAIDLKILYHIFFYSDRFGGRKAEIPVSDFNDALRHGIHTNSYTYLNKHLRSLNETYKDMLWIINDGGKYLILDPLEYYHIDKEKVSFKVDSRIKKYIGSKVKDGVDIRLTDLRLFRNTGLAFNIRLYEMFLYEAQKTAFPDSYYKLSYPEAVLMSGKIDISDEKIRKIYKGNKPDESFIYDEKLYDNFATSMSNLGTAVDTAVSELNSLSGPTGIEIKYKKLQQEKWVNRGVKLDGFLFKIMKTKEREISLEEFLSLSQTLDEKFTPNELDSIIRYQQENFGNTIREIEAYYRKNVKLGKKKLLSELLSYDIAPDEKEEREEMVRLWLKSRDVKDGRYRLGK